jgi:hypothetical protein
MYRYGTGESVRCRGPFCYICGNLRSPRGLLLQSMTALIKSVFQAAGRSS